MGGLISLCWLWAGYEPPKIRHTMKRRTSEHRTAKHWQENNSRTMEQQNIEQTT